LTVISEGHFSNNGLIWVQFDRNACRKLRWCPDWQGC